MDAPTNGASSRHGKRLYDLFAQAIALPGPDRPAFLEKHCGDDAGLRSELSDLLEEDERSSRVGFLEPSDDTGPTLRRPATDPEAELVGSRIGPYEIRAWIASGGMGSVYRAVRIDDFRQEVALKVLRPGLATAAMLRRFSTERQVLADLNHPHVARLLDGGTTPEGYPYLVMEYIDGQPVHRFCDQHQKTLHERVRLVQTIGAAVQYAHERGMIHRDLKPANVLVTVNDGPKLTDFGLVKQLDDDSGQTRTGEVLGTPSDMAPEQAAGRSREIGPATDVYALGAILYELLTGRPPFKGATWTETLEQVCTQEPPPPRRLQARLPRDLETICLKSLRKEPRERYASAREFCDDLGRFLQGAPVRARCAGLLERAWKGARRRPRAAFLAAVSAIALCAILVGGALYQRQVEESRRLVRAAALVRTLESAETANLPRIIADLAPERALADPLLRDILASAGADSRERLHASLALLPVDGGQVPFLQRKLLEATADDFGVLRDALLPYGADLASPLWDCARRPDAAAAQRLRAAGALAAFDPQSASWTDIADETTALLVRENPILVGHWLGALRPVRGHLIPPLLALLKKGVGSERTMPLNILLDYAADRVDVLGELSVTCGGSEYRLVLPALRRHAERAEALLRAEVAVTFADAAERARDERARDEQARRQAHAAITLLHLGRPELLWPLLRHSDDPRRRTYLIHALEPLGVPARDVLRRAEVEKDVSCLRALLLALGTDDTHFPREERLRIRPWLVELYCAHPDSGVHAALDWLVRRWHGLDDLKSIQAQLASRAPLEGRQWYVNGQGLTFAVIAGPVEFAMGSPASERNRIGEHETQHLRRIERSFAIGSKEVTVGQFQRFRPQHPYDARIGPHVRCPMNTITWFDAVSYCRWLSEQEGVPPEQMCYPPLDEIKEHMRPYPDYLRRTGYRLPTEAEWEYACRAGATTRFFFGNDADLLGAYGVCGTTGANRNWPVGRLKPNDFGLFDTYGNLLEWCHDRYRLYPTPAAGEIIFDVEETTLDVPHDQGRVLRGSFMGARPLQVRSARRDSTLPFYRQVPLGFRVARTLPPG